MGIVPAVNRVHKTLLCAGVATLLLPACSLAAGVLQLSDSVLRLEPGGRMPELHVENTGDTPLFLDVQQELLLNPGQSPEVLTPIEQVRAPSLLVSPRRLVLSPGQKRHMTLRTLSAPMQHRVWRLTFRPRQRVVIETTTPDQQSAPLSLNVGYGVLIYQMAVPLPPTRDIP
ncbi:hypothetical protein LGQ10_11565 [Pseudomonas sp. L5B5]|uniref:hypothetical protein n=1 Tax=Pseudomonas sp. L5B5 TaxID=2883205 RepID=UPI001CFB590A|nr:hypothetical protein [Pseudomonas sp. L5B5]UCZ86895.1 hypothetical protein LGQ10_11565 [Pseudomonas sp. L5B5]